MVTQLGSGTDLGCIRCGHGCCPQATQCTATGPFDLFGRHSAAVGTLSPPPLSLSQHLSLSLFPDISLSFPLSLNLSLLRLLCQSSAPTRCWLVMVAGRLRPATQGWCPEIKSRGDDPVPLPPPLVSGPNLTHTERKERAGSCLGVEQSGGGLDRSAGEGL